MCQEQQGTIAENCVQVDDWKIALSQSAYSGQYEEVVALYERESARYGIQLDGSLVKDVSEAYARLERYGEAIRLLEKYAVGCAESEKDNIDLLLYKYQRSCRRYSAAISTADRLLRRDTLSWKIKGLVTVQRRAMEENLYEPMGVLSDKIQTAFAELPQNPGELSPSLVDRYSSFIQQLRDCGVSYSQSHSDAADIFTAVKDYYNSDGYQNKRISYQRVADRIEKFRQRNLRPDASDIAIAEKLNWLLQILYRLMRRDLLHIEEQDVWIEVKQVEKQYELGPDGVTLKFRLSAEDWQHTPLAEFLAVVRNVVGEYRSPSIAYCPDDDDPAVVFSLKYQPTPDELKDRGGKVELEILYRKDCLKGLDDQAVEQRSRGTRKLKLPYLLKMGENFSRFENPYESVNRPTNQYFVGREELMGELQNVFSVPQGRPVGYLLYGQHYCGKSTVLENFQKWVQGQPQKFVYQGLDFESLTGDPRSFFIRKLAPKLSVNSDSDLEQAIRDYGEELREDGLVWVVGIDEFTKPYTLYCELLQKGDPGADLARGKLREFLELLRSLVEEGVLRLFMIGQEDTVQLLDDVYFGNACSRFQTRRLTYLTKEAIERLAALPLAGCPVKDFYRGDTLKDIIRYSGCHPWFAVSLFEQVFTALNRRHFPFVQYAIVQDAVDHFVLSESSGYLRQSFFEPFFCLRTNGFTEDVVKEFYKKLVHEQPGWIPQSRAVNLAGNSKLVDLLCDREILERKNEKIRFRVRLFEEWFRNYFQIRSEGADE